MLFFRGLPVITLALSKGRIDDQTVPLLKAAGGMARLVVDQAALKVKRAAIQPLLDAFARAVS
jgi:ATP phosphoribosyltransferase